MLSSISETELPFRSYHVPHNFKFVSIYLLCVSFFRFKRNFHGIIHKMVSSGG